MEEDKRLYRMIRHSLTGLYDALHAIKEHERSGSLGSSLQAQIHRLEEKMRWLAGPQEVVSHHMRMKQRYPRGSVVTQRRQQEPDSATANGVKEAEKWTSERIVHEMLLDPGFRPYGRVDDDDVDLQSIRDHGNVQNCVEKAFWASLKEDLEFSKDTPSPYGFIRVFSVLEEAKNSILKLSPSGPEAEAVQGIIDVALIRQRVETNAFSFADCTKLMEGLMGIVENLHCRMNAPSSVAESKKCFAQAVDGMKEAQQRTWCVQCNALVHALQVTLDRIHVVRKDHANKLFGRLAPSVAHNGISFASMYFDRSLRSGNVDPAFPVTVQLFKTSLQGLVAVTRDSDLSMDKMRGGDAQSFAKFIYSTMATFICTYPLYGDVHIGTPELMRLDEGRFKGLHAKFLVFSMQAVVQVTVIHLLRGRVDSENVVRVVGEELRKEKPDPTDRGCRYTHTHTHTHTHMHCCFHCLHGHGTFILHMRRSLEVVCRVVDEFVGTEMAGNLRVLLAHNLEKHNAVYRIMVSFICSVFFEMQGFLLLNA